MKTINNKRRYRLHYRVRKQGFIIITKDKTISVDHDKVGSITKQVKILLNEFNYSLQTKLY